MAPTDPQPTRKHTATSAAPSSTDRRDVTVKSVHPAALAAALRLAGGDRSRLRFDDDGNVTVANDSRVARRQAP